MRPTKYTRQCLKKPKEAEVKTDQQKKWVDMQCITFAIKHNKTWRKKNRQDRKDFFPKMCSIFMTGLLKNPIILEESRNWMINTAASVVVSIEWKKRLDHIRVSWELGPHTDFFPVGPAGTLWWTLRENGLLEFLRTLATARRRVEKPDAKTMRWFFYANRHQIAAFLPVWYLLKIQSYQSLQIAWILRGNNTLFISYATFLHRKKNEVSFSFFQKWQ